MPCRGRVPVPFALAMMHVCGVGIRVCMVAEAGTCRRPMAPEWAYGTAIGSGGTQWGAERAAAAVQVRRGRVAVVVYY